MRRLPGTHYPRSAWCLLLTLAACLARAEPIPTDAGRNSSALNVSVAVLDPGIPTDQSIHRDQDVFPRIRNIEALFLPSMIRQTLVETGEWGAVRVVPGSDATAEVLVTGTITHSDGETLTLHVRAVDATGRVWVDKPFTGNVTEDYADSEPDSGAPGYQALYEEIGTALLYFRNTLNDKEIITIREVSLLRYGAQIAPVAFGDFITVSPDGEINLNRLPAENDPMIDRIALVRSTEYVITDAVDAKFRELHAEIASVYDVWREFRRETLRYAKEDARRAADTADDGERGSYEALRNAYDNYKYHRVTEQEQDRLAVAFITEVGPRIEAVELRVAEMQEWVEQKYVEWRRILEELFEVETGLPE